MWNPKVVSWLGENGFVYVKHIGQHICFGAMSDILANNPINVIKGTFTQNTDYMDIICYIEHTGYAHL